MSTQKTTFTSIIVLGISAIVISFCIILYEIDRMFCSKRHNANAAIENIAIQVQLLRDETNQIKAMIKSPDTCKSKVDTIFIPVPCKYIN